MKSKLTQKELKRLLHYDSETGFFTWLADAKNKKYKAGDIAGSVNPNGYVYIYVHQKHCRAHSLACLYMKGYYPDFDLTHKNGITHDNKWENLLDSLDSKEFLSQKRRLTQKELKRVLHYNPDTGIFTRKVSLGKVKAGEVAGSPHKASGYIHISIHKKKHRANRLAWLYMEGYWPEHEIDHIDGVRDNNKWLNLRHGSHSCNMQNTKTRVDNKTKFVGVSFYKAQSKWQATMTVQGSTFHLGYYDDIFEAALARYTCEQHCDKWRCNSRSELVASIKKIWPEFRPSGVN